MPKSNQTAIGSRRLDFLKEREQVDYVTVAQGLMLPFLGTTLGAAVVFFLRRDMPSKLTKVLVGFAAGVMVVATGLSWESLYRKTVMGSPISRSEGTHFFGRSISR